MAKSPEYTPTNCTRSPFTPWSEALPSTSPSLDAQSEQPCKIGTRCKDGSFFVTPLDHPWPFGVGKCLRTRRNGTLLFQWYEAPNPNRPAGPYLPCWWDGSAHYRADQPTESTHAPFTSEHTDSTITQRDLSLHGFELGPDAHLSTDVLQACSTHPDILWSRRATRLELKRAAEPQKRNAKAKRARR